MKSIVLETIQSLVRSWLVILKIDIICELAERRSPNDAQVRPQPVTIDGDVSPEQLGRAVIVG